MSEPSRYSYPRYLTAKTPVDGRALNRRVWDNFLNALVGCSSLRILEVGGGVGATVKRIVSALEDRSPERIEYTFVDVTPENVDRASSLLRDWARAQGYEASGTSVQSWYGRGVDVTINFRTADLFDLSGTLDRASYDAIVAQAVLDLMPLGDAIRSLRPLLRNGGLWYLPLHFDGTTAFEPRLDSTLDAKIERLYHESMSGERREGARSGRALLQCLPSQGASLVATGGADWIVYPQENGYPGDEDYFLYHILHFVEHELSGHPALRDEAFTTWIDRRRSQVDKGKLIYVAHHLDVLAKQNGEGT